MDRYKYQIQNWQMENDKIIGLLAKEFDCRIIHIPYSKVTKSIIATKDKGKR